MLLFSQKANKQRKIKHTNESKRIFNGFFHSVLFGTEKHEKKVMLN